MVIFNPVKLTLTTTFNEHHFESWAERTQEHTHYCAIPSLEEPGGWVEAEGKGILSDLVITVVDVCVGACGLQPR